MNLNIVRTYSKHGTVHEQKRERNYFIKLANHLF